jgi:signal transduction histidine kinase
MMDLRRMLTALSTAAPEMPAPGLDELEALVAAHSATHGPVDLSVDALVASEAASLRLTVYRIVQEALTNVGRHAPGAKAVVDVSCTDNQVVVRVEDDGRVRRRPRTGGGGFGLAGMRERVALAGGTFSTGPTRVGGFQVEAKLVRSPVELDPSRAHEAAR